MADSFVHLHQHTEYSMLDGAARVADVVAAAAADGQPALGITDHGNMYGVLDFYKACRNKNITPILGFEAYMALENRRERPVRRGRVDDSGGDSSEGQKLYYHLTLLAESNEGYRNLMQLSSRAFLEGYYYKPRLDWELLEEHRKGLIATTGCLGGIVLQHLMRGENEQALAAAARLQEIFGRDSLFVELQDHGIDKQRQTNPQLIEIARRIGAPLLATNDSHYVSESDAAAHDALLCVQTGSTMEDPNRFRFDGSQHYLKSAAEMRSLFSGVEVACDNTLWIAERANVEIEFDKPELPEFPLPEGFVGQGDYLRHLTLVGARERYGNELPGEVVERIEYELGVIEHMGFSAYFLVVWDLIRYAREKGIRVGPGRGSAAGCCVAYCLRIVDLDPIRYGLIFERFLNPGRKQMPDIDMDFDERFRGEMIRYAAARYGSDRVAQIITFSVIRARAAVRDASRVLNLPYALGDKIAKAMPPLVMGRDTPLWACFEPDDKYKDGYAAAAELREIYDSDPEARRVIDVARGLEGLRRQDSIHAAAVVITREPLTEYLPIQRKPDPNTPPELAPVVTQFDMHGVESLGLLKMDFLGLRNLSVIENALDLIARSTGERPDIDTIPLDDEKTFEMLRDGGSIGVFQLEGGPMRALMRSLAPTGFDDVCALVALYRPGPMSANMHTDYADRKNGRKPIELFHPDAEPILRDTYGLMIYQESVMEVARHFAGYSMEQADNLRKACGKKIREVMAKERAQFVEGCDKEGFGTAVGNKIFDIIEPFADYAFNKSHSYGYGLVAYQTAWLKANYPVEYLAALLTSVKDDKDKAAVYLAECRTLGVPVGVPDVNLSESDFAAVDGRVVYGLSAVRNVGEAMVEMVIAEREKNGPYESFLDFAKRVDPQVLNKRAIESLIKAGAFDSLHSGRRGLQTVSEVIIDQVLMRRREYEAGVMSLFGETSGEPSYDDLPTPTDHEWSKTERLAFEKEMLGLYLSDHPLLGVEHHVRKVAEMSIGELRDAEEGPPRWVGGVITSYNQRYTRRGDLMATFVLEDLGAAIECWVYPRAMQAVRHLLAADSVVAVKGRLDRREEPVKFSVLEVKPISTEFVSEAPPLTVRLPDGVSDEGLAEFRVLLQRHPGASSVFVVLAGKRVKLSEQFRVNASGSLLGEIRALFGSRSLIDAV